MKEEIIVTPVRNTVCQKLDGYTWMALALTLHSILIFQYWIP